MTRTMKGKRKQVNLQSSDDVMINTKEIYTKSNLLSLFRLLLAVPFWILLDNFDSQTIRYVTFALCLFAAFTDILDGLLARRFNEVTEFGKIIDPLADKVAIGAIVIQLYLIGEISPFYFFLIIGRDALIFLGGIFVSNKLGKVLPSNMLGKITVLNIGLIILLIILNVNRDLILFEIFYYSSIILIVVSFIAYLIRSIEYIKQSENEPV